MRNGVGHPGARRAYKKQDRSFSRTKHHFKKPPLGRGLATLAAGLKSLGTHEVGGMGAKGNLNIMGK